MWYCYGYLASLWTVCVFSWHKLVFSDKSRIAPKTMDAKNTMEALLGKKWFDNTVLEDSMAAMEKVTLTLPCINP